MLTMSGSLLCHQGPLLHAAKCPAASPPVCRSLPHASVRRPSCRPARLVRAAATPTPATQPPPEPGLEDLPNAPGESVGEAGPEATNPAVQAAAEESDQFEAIPQQRIRIKLKSYSVPAIQQSVQTIIEAANSTGAKVSGPVYLPTRIRKYTVLTSPHVNKNAREQFEIRTHSRLMDVKNLSGPTVDKLMQLDLPAGVDVKVTL